MNDESFSGDSLPPCVSREDIEHFLVFGNPATRRTFLKQVAGTGAAIALGPKLAAIAQHAPVTAAGSTTASAPVTTVPLCVRINGKDIAMDVDPRTTMLDLLREGLNLTGSKKGCDHGQCGACTVLVNGRRVNSCLSLAVMNEGAEITTIEGLAKGDELHPVQAAFLERDAFQCGYCTPGQICSAVACISEGHTKDDAEIREWMSGNLCRCGAYPNIVDAIKDAAGHAHA